MWGTAQCKQAWQLGVLVKLTRLFEPEKNVRMRKLGRMKSHAPTTSLILIRCDTVTQKVPGKASKNVIDGDGKMRGVTHIMPQLKAPCALSDLAAAAKSCSECVALAFIPVPQ